MCLHKGGLPDLLRCRHADAVGLYSSAKDCPYKQYAAHQCQGLPFQLAGLCSGVLPLFITFCACRPASEADNKHMSPEQQLEQAEPLPAPLPATPVPSSHRSAASSASLLDASVDELAAAVERMGPDR